MTIRLPSWLSRIIRIILPLTIGLTFLLSTGPQVQSYVLSFFNSTVPSVYGSSYKDQLVNFPTLREWAAVALYWQFFIMAFCIMLTVVGDTKPRTIFWRVALSSFIVLFVFDLGFSIFHNNFTLKSIFENLVGDLVGCVIISGLIILMISLSDILFLQVSASLYIKKFIAASGAIVSGFMFLVVIYYFADIFYNPLSVRLESHLAAPVGGALIFNEKKNQLTSQNQVNSEKSANSLVPTRAIHSRASWTAAAGQQRIAFKSLSPSTLNKVEISFLSGSCNAETIEKMPVVEPALKFSDIESGNIAFDEGVSMLEILQPKSATSKFSIAIKNDLSLFWLKQDSESKDRNLTYFIGEGDSVKITAAQKNTSLLLSAPLMGVKVGKAVLSTRILSVNFGKNVYSIRFLPSKTMRSDSVSECKFVDASNIEKYDSPGFWSANGVKSISNVLVRIKQDEDPQTLTSEETEILVSGAGGWLKLDSLKADEFENHQVGKLELVQVRGNISQLALDGQPMDARPLSTYTAVGEFSATYGEGGTLMVSGLAKALWKDQGRLNMTKWEKLSWEPMLFILGLLGTVTVWLSARLAKCLRENSPFTWLS